MRPRFALWLLALSVVACPATGCGAARDPIRIGIITECPSGGTFGQFQEPLIAGAELPLIDRGARVAGATPSTGLEGASVGGRPVKLENVCAEQLNEKSALFQLRRLVESRHVAAVLGPTNELDPIVARYARRHPGIVFMLTSYDQSSTLRFAAPNMFRFELDSAQLSAGLAAYAYHRLGWRNMTTVGEDDPAGWAQAAGFNAEFCALGGRIRPLWAPAGAGPDAYWARRVSSKADGVFLSPGYYNKSGFVRRWARQHHLPRQLVVGWDAVNPSNPDPRLRGVVTVSSWPWMRTPALRAYEDRFAKAFPTIPDYVDPMTYYDEMEPLLEALEKVQGDTSNGEQSLQHALANLQYDSPEGPLHLDKRHQGIGPTYLGRIRSGGATARQFAVIHDVDETFGGYFMRHRVPPGPKSPGCFKGKPPPWAARPTT